MSEWISVKERQPEPRKKCPHSYLVWVKCDNLSGGYRDMAAFGPFRYFDDADYSEPDDEGLNVQGHGWHKEEETHGGEFDYIILDLNSKVTYWQPLPDSPAPPETEESSIMSRD